MLSVIPFKAKVMGLNAEMCNHLFNLVVISLSVCNNLCSNMILSSIYIPKVPQEGLKTTGFALSF